MAVSKEKLKRTQKSRIEEPRESRGSMRATRPSIATLYPQRQTIEETRYGKPSICACAFPQFQPFRRSACYALILLKAEVLAILSVLPPPTQSISRTKNLFTAIGKRYRVIRRTRYLPCSPNPDTILIKIISYMPEYLITVYSVGRTTPLYGRNFLLKPSFMVQGIL